MSWGNRLLLVFVAFAGLMSYMVYRCVQTPVELVSSEYYKDELAYQNVINDSKKANALSKSLHISREGGSIVITFPPELNNMPLNGNVYFYCASDENKDRKFSLNISNGGRWKIQDKSFIPGHYLVKIQWHSNNSDYYSEQPLIIP